MAEKSRQTQEAGKRPATCGNAAAAHIDVGTDIGARAARFATTDAPRPAKNGRSAGSGAVWGGDRDDPRLFYFRVLLGSGWFFGGVERA